MYFVHREVPSPGIYLLSDLTLLPVTKPLDHAAHPLTFVFRTLLVVFTVIGIQAPVQAQALQAADTKVQFHRARTAFESGNSLLEAKARIDRVLKLDPEDVEALKLRASILMGLDRKEDAIDDAIFAVSLAPKDGEAQLLLCETAYANGNQELAKKALKNATDVIAKQAGWLVRLSSCALALGDPQRAEALARIAVAANELEPKAHIQLARIFSRSGRTQDAISVLNKMVSNSLVSEKAIMQDPEFSTFYIPKKGR